MRRLASATSAAQPVDQPLGRSQIQRAFIQGAADHGADVANTSIGDAMIKSGNGRHAAMMQRVFNYAHRKGTLVVVAAGNDYFGRAIMYQRLGDFENALVSYRQVLQRDDLNVDAVFAKLKGIGGGKKHDDED